MIIQTPLESYTVLVAHCRRTFLWFFHNFLPIRGGPFPPSRHFHISGNRFHLYRPKVWILSFCTPDFISRKTIKNGIQILHLIFIPIYLWAPRAYPDTTQEVAWLVFFFWVVLSLCDHLLHIGLLVMRTVRCYFHSSWWLWPLLLHLLFSVHWSVAATTLCASSS